MIAAVTIVLLGLYEIFAFATRRVPTITDILQSHWVFTYGSVAVIIFAAAWAVLHVLGAQ